MTNENIRYKSREIVKYFSNNRDTWDRFYPSEKWVFKKIAKDKKDLGDILDAGCACGGLGAALNGKFMIDSYTGIDMNKDAIRWAQRNRKLPFPVNFITGDILDLKLNNRYDIVVSLSCADWNIETNKIIKSCWKKVKKGGYMVISLRLTDKKSINNIKKSYQLIDRDPYAKNPEVANYVVFNLKEATELFKDLNPSPACIGAYGYWGKPSPTAVTPFDKLVFAVFYVKKGARSLSKKRASRNPGRDLKVEFNLPAEIFSNKSMEKNA